MSLSPCQGCVRYSDHLALHYPLHIMQIGVPSFSCDIIRNRSCDSANLPDEGLVLKRLPAIKCLCLFVGQCAGVSLQIRVNNSWLIQATEKLPKKVMTEKWSLKIYLQYCYCALHDTHTDTHTHTHSLQWSLQELRLVIVCVCVCVCVRACAQRKQFELNNSPAAIIQQLLHCQQSSEHTHTSICEHV